VVVAAGNDGTDKDGDGEINPGSVSAPGTAKNCITVGASESRRPQFAAQRYGAWWPRDYPAAPLHGRSIAADPDQLAPFSSRGPTQDGRCKPDLVAPGTFILSTRSRRIASNNTGWSPCPASRLYFYMGGTSMATPLVAGAAAVVREFLRTRRKIASPSAALVKAVLIAGARRLPGTAPAGAVLDPHQGFGRVDLDAVLAPPRPAQATFLDEGVRLRTGQLHALTLRVKSSKAALRVAMAYTDAPGASLVNNLNLILRSPSGKAFAGNQPAGGPPAPDAANNAEVVQVAAPEPGDWQLQVVASNVPQGAQDFALVCLGHL
jgi:serine protease AprX